MRFLKQKTLSKYSPSDQTLFTNHYGRAVMEITGGLRLPKGTTAQRPQLSGVRTTGGANGFMRYNTSTNSIEAYVDGVWEVVRAPGATAITKQTLGPGNEVETTFGPLTKIPNSENNILVFVENVFQISDTNYNLVDNYLGSGNTYIVFTSSVPLDKYITIYYGYAD
jgi:hypothetical protein